MPNQKPDFKTAFDQWFERQYGPMPNATRALMYPLEAYNYGIKKAAAWAAWSYLAHLILKGKELPFEIPEESKD
jgi:hypothetical protein